MKLNYPLRFGLTFLLLGLAARFWISDGVDRGLDLKGGASLTYELDKAEVARIKAKHPRAEPLLETVLTIEERINIHGLQDVKVDALSGDQFEVQFPGKESSEVNRIKKLLTELGQLEFRIVAPDTVLEEERGKKERGGADYEVTSGLRWVEPRPTYDKDGNLVRKPVILVEIPEAKREEEIKRIEGLRSRREAEQAKQEALLAEATGPEKEKIEERLRRARNGIKAANKQIADATKALEETLKKEFFAGEDLDSGELEARLDQPPKPGWLVAFAFVGARSKDFANFTDEYTGRPMAIIIDGKYASAPVIQGRLPGGGVITGGQGGFKEREAQDLVTVLRSGSLSVGITLMQEWSIGPSLGEEAIRRGVLATVIGLVGVVIFMVGTYMFPGLVAVFALLMNLLLIMGALAFARAQLSLPGIAGVILTVGMAVDANILVFERIREELNRGRALLQAVKAGYDRAFVTIVDANVTTLFAAVILYMMTAGQVRGFAATLVVGILASMFTSLFVTKAIFGWLIEKGLVRNMRMPHLFGVPRLSYMKVRLPMIAFSLVLVAAGLFTFLRVGDEKYDIEFVGGQRVIVAFQKPVPIQEVKDKIREEYESATVISIKSEKAAQEDLHTSAANDRYQITIQAAKEESQHRGVIDFLKDAFRDILMPDPLSITAVEDAGRKDLYEVQLNFSRPVTQEEVAKVLDATEVLTEIEDLRIEGFTARFRCVQTLGEAALQGKLDDSIQALEDEEDLDRLSLSEPFPMRSSVTPQTAQRHRADAALAVALSLMFQILYIYFRFKGAAFGFAAVLALVHDVTITLGAIAFFGWIGLVNVKINLPIIAAILTLIGYSMNDSIVVFDRIRENLRKGKQNLAEVIDLSVNQTMGRTLRTSLTTFMVVLVLFVVNYGAASSVLEGFAFVLMIGVITGTYSSIFVASPMLLFLPWHYIRGKGGRYWGFMALSLVGFVGWLFLKSDTSTHWVVLCVAAGLAYPAYFFIDLFRWLALKDPDRALNIALRRHGAHS